MVGAPLPSLTQLTPHWLVERADRLAALVELLLVVGVGAVLKEEPHILTPLVVSFHPQSTLGLVVRPPPAWPP